MKIFKRFILGLSFFLVFLCSKSFTSYASFQPPMLPTNTNVVLDFLTSVATTELSSHGVGLVNPNQTNTLNRIVNGRTIEGSLTRSFVDLGSTSWTMPYNLYDSNGTLVPQEDAYMALFQTDVGNATGIYSKSTGEPLLTGDDFSSAESSIIVNFGTGSQHIPLIGTVLSTADEVNGVFVDPSLTQEVKEQYQSYAFSGYCRSSSEGFVCYVPNACSPNTVIVPFNNQYEVNWSGSYYPDSRLFTVYTNDPSEVIFVPPNTQFGRLSYVSYGVGLYGSAFHYIDSWDNAYNIFWNGGEVYYKTPTESQYQSLKDNNVVYTQPVINNNDVYNNYYNYDSYTNNPPTYNNTYNSYYTINQPTSPDNYPVNRTVNLGDYSPNYNYYTSYNEYINNPVTGESVGTIPETNLPTSLPLLNNLHRRFPFSIPFDIYNMLSNLSADREPPLLEYTLTIPYINYDWNISIDFALFNDSAELFRICFLVLFIIGLAIFSYNHFFGS